MVKYDKINCPSIVRSIRKIFQMVLEFNDLLVEA